MNKRSTTDAIWHPISSLRATAAQFSAALIVALCVPSSASWAQTPRTPAFPAKPLDGSNETPSTPQIAASLFTLKGAGLELAKKGDFGVNTSDFEYAADQYANAALTSPSDPLLRMMLGIVLSSSPHSDKALEQFRKAVRLADDDVVAALLLQGAIAEQGDANEAQSLFQDIHRRFAANDGKDGLNANASITRLLARAQLEPDSAIVQLLLGDAYQLANDWNRADVAYRKAADFAPAWSKPCVNRGLLYLAQGNSDQAIVVFSEAVKRDPKNSQARVWIGEAQFRRGKTAQAINTLGSVAESSGVPASVRAQATMVIGKALATQQHYAKAVATLTEAQKLAPDDPSAPAALGEVQEKAGNYSAAADAYGNALRLSAGSGLFDSSRPVLMRSLVTAQLAAHRPNEALVTLRDAMASAPNSAPLWCRMMAQAEFELGNRSAAETDLCNALDQEEEHYPFDTLTSISEHNLLTAVRNLYQTQLGEVDTSSETRVATSDPHAVVIQGNSSPNPHATSFERTKALAALASIARYENHTADEIRYRKQLTTLRSVGADWFLLAETYDQSAGLPIPARDAYQQALELGGLNNTQKAWAKRRLASLTAPAYKP